MGLLDKLKDSVNLDKLKDAAGGVLEMAKETISQVVEEGSKAIESSKATESTQQPSPLDEPNVLSYLNIIYRLVAKSSYTRPQVQRYVEKYVTVRLGETFDPEVFEKVLPYCPCKDNGEYFIAAWRFEEGTPDFGADTARIKELVEAARYGVKDCLSDKEIYELFLDELQAALHAVSDVDVEEFLSQIEDVHAEYALWTGHAAIAKQTSLICRSVFEKALAKDYNKILVVLRDRWNDGTDYVDIYREGFERIYSHYAYGYGYCGTKEMLTEILHDLVKASYLADESAIQRAVGINYHLTMIRLWKTKSLRDIAIAGIALRAVNFAQYGDNRETYPSLTEEKCREFILNNAYFQARLKKEHAFELEKYTESFIQSLVKCRAPGAGPLDARTAHELIVECLLFKVSDEDYYIDSVCHRVARDFDHALTDANVTFKALLEDMQI